MVPLKKAAAICSLLFLASCTSKNNSNVDSANDTTSTVELTRDSLPSKERTPTNATPIKIDKVETSGDFDGDGKQEEVGVLLISEGEQQSKNWIYKVIFSNPSIPSFTFECGTESYVVMREGQLNTAPGDELSIVTPHPIMGGAGVAVFTFVKGVWGNAMASFLSTTLMPDSIPLEDLIITKNSQTFFYEYHLQQWNDEDDNQATGFYERKAKLYDKIEPLPVTFLESEIIDESDFDGNGNLEAVRTVVIDDRGEGEGTSYRIEFSNRSIPSMEIGSLRGFDVWVEEDLDGRPGNELSVLTGMTMMNYNFVSIYSLRNGKWVKIFDGLQTRDILPEGVHRTDLIFKENNIVYSYEDNVVDQLAKKVDGATLRTEIKLK